MKRLVHRHLSQATAFLVTVLALTASAQAGGRTLVTQGVIDATPHEVWEAFTVDSEITKWMVAVAHMDLRIGGTLETSYDEKAKIGDPKNIRLEILSYEPDRMLSFTFVMPKMFEQAHAENGHWDVIRFEPLSPHKTLVTETIYGWGEGPDWDRAYAFFDKGNAWTMEQLQKHFAPKEPSKPEAALDFLRQLAGGVWTSEVKQPEGGVFRAKFYYEDEPGHPCLTAKSWLGDAKKLNLHALTTVGLDGKSGEIVQQSFLEDGSLVRVSVRAKAGRAFMAGELLGSNGKAIPIRQELTLKDPTHLDIVIHLGDEKDPSHRKIALSYVRVERDPDVEAPKAKAAAAR